MERARAFAPPAGRSRGECGSGIALTRSPARPKIGAVHRGGGETSGSSSLGKQDRRAGDEIVPMHPRWERILRGESAYARFQRMYRTAFALVPSPWRCKFYNAPFKGPVAGTLKWWSGAHPPARARSASLSRFGGIATIVPASDYVSTFRGEGVGPDLVGLAVADHVSLPDGRAGRVDVGILWLTYRLD
jgi:hypothetical protein